MRYPGSISWPVTLDPPELVEGQATLVLHGKYGPTTVAKYFRAHTDYPVADLGSITKVGAHHKIL